MSTEGVSNPAKQAKEDFAVISNRLAVAFAKRESLIKSWTASSARPRPAETEEELDAEDATLFHNQPQYLGVGAPIPSHFLVSEAERNNKSLRAKFFPTKGLKASKARDAEEKAASAKRGLKQESSDEEEGRSGLGRTKKLKLTKKSEPAKKIVKEESDSDGDGRASVGKSKKSKATKLEATKEINTNQAGGVQQSVQTSAEATDVIMTGSEGKLEHGAKTSKPSEKGSSAQGNASKTIEGLRPTDPAELKRLKKREKKRRAKLRAAMKEN